MHANENHILTHMIYTIFHNQLPKW